MNAIIEPLNSQFYEWSNHIMIGFSSHYQSFILTGKNDNYKVVIRDNVIPIKITDEDLIKLSKSQSITIKYVKGNEAIFSTSSILNTKKYYELTENGYIVAIYPYEDSLPLSLPDNHQLIYGDFFIHSTGIKKWIECECKRSYRKVQKIDFIDFSFKNLKPDNEPKPIRKIFNADGLYPLNNGSKLAVNKAFIDVENKDTLNIDY